MRYYVDAIMQLKNDNVLSANNRQAPYSLDRIAGAATKDLVI